MRRAPVLWIPIVLLGCAAPRGGEAGTEIAPAGPGQAGSPAGGSAQAGSAQAEASRDEAESSPEAATLERTGILAPVEPIAVKLWPEAWSGEMLVLEVVEHGTRVEAGDVLARLDTRAYDEQLAAAERDLVSAEVRHAGLLEKNKLAEEGEVDSLAQATARLDRARRALEGYLTRELAFSERQDELSTLREKHNIEDQQDELGQLEKMYDADELVDDTEEIVLKRSRRQLAMTLDQVELSRARRAHEDELSRPLQVEARMEDVTMQEQALGRLERSQAVDRASRADAEARSAAELEEKRARLERLRADAALFTLKAPSAGIVLHGEADDYRPGTSPKRLERGSRLTLRSEVMLVADPARMAVALEVPESKLSPLRSGAEARVRPLARPEPALEGVLELEAWPQPKGGDEGVFAGTVRLEGPPPEGLLFGMRAKVELALEPTPEG